MHWFVSHLIYLSLTTPTMQHCFHLSAKYLLYRYITPNFVGHSFHVEAETRYFFANSPLCTCHLDLIPKIFLCRYASRTLRMKLLTWCRVISLTRLFGSGRARAEVCQNISGLHTKLFYNIKSNEFFLS